MLLSTILSLSFPPFILAQGTVPKCTFDNPPAAALTSVILDCYNTLGADPSSTLVVNSDSVTPCYRVTRDRSAISKVTVRRREGHDGELRTTKGQVACAVGEILDRCGFGGGGRLVGGKYVVCGSDELAVEVEGEGNN